MRKYIYNNVIKKRKIEFFLMSIITLTASGITVMTSRALQEIIDYAIPSGDKVHLFLHIQQYVFLLLLGIGLSMLFSFMVSVLTLKIDMGLRKDMIESLLCRDGEYLSKKEAGEIFQVVMSDPSTIGGFIVGNIFSVLYKVCSLVFSVIYLVSLNGKMLLLIMIIQPLCILLQKIFAKVIEKQSNEQRKCSENFFTAIQDLLLRPIDIMMMGISSFVKNNTFEKMELEYTCQKKLSALGVLASHINETVSSLSMCMVIVYGGYLIMQGKISIGVLVVFMTYSGKIINNLLSLWNMRVQFSELKPIFNRFSENMIFDLQAVHRPEVSFESVKSDLIVQNLSFAYDESKAIYKNASASFGEGKKYGIVGKTGEGKSTFAKMIFNMWESYEGKLLLSGRDCHTISTEQIAERVLYLPAEPIIFSDTIRNNIVVGKEVSDETVYDILKKVCLFDKVKSLEDGLETHMGEKGANFSSGEKQRIALARLFLANQSIIILDEPTSMLDEETKDLVFQEVYKYCLEKTLIVITHDESILEDFDCVYELINYEFRARTGQ